MDRRTSKSRLSALARLSLICDVGFKKMNAIKNIIACVALAALASGCATGRIADLRDCGRASVGLGLGLGVEATLGVIGNPSLGITSYKQMYGLENRHCAGMWAENEVFWPTSSAVGLLMGGLSDGSTRGPDHFTYAPYGRNIDDDTHLRRDNWRQHKRERNFSDGNRRKRRPSHTGIPVSHRF